MLPYHQIRMKKRFHQILTHQQSKHTKHIFTFEIESILYYLDAGRKLFIYYFSYIIFSLLHNLHNFMTSCGQPQNHNIRVFFYFFFTRSEKQDSILQAFLQSAYNFRWCVHFFSLFKLNLEAKYINKHLTKHATSM